LRPSLAADDMPCDLKAATPPNCEDYCKLTQTACVAGNRVYDDNEQCLSVCQKGFAKPAGVEKEKPDSALDTLQCRRWHAYFALTTDPVVHCGHAGPGGDGHCGKQCEVFCGLLKAGCKKRFDTEYGANADTAECVKDCGDLAGFKDSYSLEAEAVRTNTYQCRLHQVTKVFAASGSGNGNAMAACENAFPKDTCTDQ
jgi:hypothetical protein